MTEKCPGNLALFPAVSDKGDGYFAINSIQKLKVIVERETGVRFNLRTCRRTFAQMAIGQKIDLDTVSVLMGHSTTKTTESYYGRKRPEDAIREAEAVYLAAYNHPDAKHPKIESRFEVTGNG